MENKLKLVKEFIKVFEDHINEEPSLIPQKAYELRYKLLKEENEKYLKACEKGDLVQILDAVTDMLYVLYGTIIAHGFENVIDKSFEEIHESNMSKLGEDGKPIKRLDGKIIKGPNYFPPNLSKFVKQKVILDTEKLKNELKELGITAYVKTYSKNVWVIETIYSPLEEPVSFEIKLVNEELKNVKITDDNTIESSLSYIYNEYSKRIKISKEEFIIEAYKMLKEKALRYGDDRLNVNMDGGNIEMCMYTHVDHIVNCVLEMKELFDKFASELRKQLRFKYMVEI
jgi:predicted HAD superfamily Cof-like phosphohydrolase